MLYQTSTKLLIIIVICLGLISCQKDLLINCEKDQEREKIIGVEAKLERVISGQTIEISDPANPTGKLQQVRLIGIEAPDLKQLPWGEDAKKQLETIFTDKKNILLEADEEPEDRFKRLLRYVWLNGELINAKMVQSGYVLASGSIGNKNRYSSPNIKYNSCLVLAQERARIMGKGIWNPSQPMRQTPGEFRRQNSR